MAISFARDKSGDSGNFKKNHLKLGWQALAQRQEPWSALRFLARLSPGLCLSNLFVLHFAGAYVLDEPIELSVFVCCAYLLMTFLLSLLVSLLPLFLVEGCVLPPQWQAGAAVTSHDRSRCVLAEQWSSSGYAGAASSRGGCLGMRQGMRPLF